MKKKLHKLILVFLLCRFHVAAQTAGYNYEAPITPVDSSGFYNIVLTSQLNACLKTDYSDLRIVNDSGKWVPHLVREPAAEIKMTPQVLLLSIIKNENAAVQTEVIVRSSARVLSSLDFKIKNTEAQRFCTLSGSEDMVNWYIINDSIKLVVQRDNDEESFFRLAFPPVPYKYLRVQIQNQGKDPLNILQAISESYILPEQENEYLQIENPPVKIVQLDSAKISLIRVEQQASYHFDKLSLNLTGVKYFNRSAALYIPSSVDHSFANPGTLTENFTVSNNSTLEFDVPKNNAKTFYIFIFNEDNLPLKTTEVKTFASYIVATVYLERSKKYKLLLDNVAASTPNYDLQAKDIPSKETIPSVITGEITTIQKQGIAAQSKDNSKNLIWIVIGIAAVVLGFFTYRLVTDMNRSKS